MAHFLLEAAYTPEGWNALVKKPQNRLEAVTPVVERLGGRVESMWFAFGEYDVVAVIELPDNTKAAAFSMAVAASGAVRDIRTRPLLTVDEGLEAMAMAGASGYSPPHSFEIVYDH